MYRILEILDEYAYGILFTTTEIMAVTGHSSIESKQRENTRLRYLEADNILDITKDDLTNLITEINKNKEETIDIEKESGLDQAIIDINTHVERYFDGFLVEKRNTTISLNGSTITKTPRDIIMGGDPSELQALSDYVIRQSGYEKKLENLKNKEIINALTTYKFELKNLWSTIASSEEHAGSLSNNNTTNVFLNNMGDNSVEEMFMETYHIEPYSNNYYTPQLSKSVLIENIYNDKRLHKTMENIFDDEEKKELRRGSFAINLGIDDGLAGIIVAIRNAIKEGGGEVSENTQDDELSDGNFDKNNTSSPGSNGETPANNKLYSYLKDNTLISGDNTLQNIKTKNIKEMIKLGYISYDRKGGLDNEKGKIAKILTRAKREDLDEFASLVQANPDIQMVMKQWNNALEITGNSRIDRAKERPSLITKDNVLEFLCDINGDGILSAQYQKNRRQKNQGDVGPIFGQQLFFTVEQAIKVKNVELGSPQGEQFVISNIVKNMQISDKRNLTGNQRILLDEMANNSKNCTTANLAKLINGDGTDGVSAMPTFKIYFFEAIRKINGGSSEITPNLYDTLVGKDAEMTTQLYETLYQKEAEMRTRIDTILEQSQDPYIKQAIERDGKVFVRETILTQIINTLDNVELIFNDKTRIPLGAAATHGAKKRRERLQTRNDLLGKIAKHTDFGLQVSPKGTVTASLGIGKSGISTNGTTKRERTLSSGVTVGKGNLLIDILGISGGIDKQYNKKAVINANLSDVKSAKYIGIEGNSRLAVGIGGGQVDAGIGGHAGINRSKNPEIGINQLNQQYQAVSTMIFSPLHLNTDNLTAETVKNTLMYNLGQAQNDPSYGKFITTNQKRLEENIDFVVSYLTYNKFFGDNGVFALNPNSKEKSAIEALFTMLQSGNLAARQHDVLSGLHGKIDITQLSFGVTSSMFTLKTWKKEAKPITATTSTGGHVSTEAPLQPSATENLDIGDNVIPDGAAIDTAPDWTTIYTPIDKDNVDTGGNVATPPPPKKYGALFAYVGAKLSTWQNSYAPNIPRALATHMKLQEGLGTQRIENPQGNLEKYAEYLTALYNDPSIQCKVQDNKLIIVFTEDKTKPHHKGLTIARYLNLHATPEVMDNFSYTDTQITIGNVKDIGAYTITEAKGIRRILCLGSKKMEEAKAIAGPSAHPASAVSSIEKTFTEYETRTQPNIYTIIDNIASSEETNKQTLIRTKCKKFFDAEGKLTTPEGYTVNYTGIEQGAILKTGTLTITKNEDNNYTVSYSTTPNAKLTISYVDKNEYEAFIEGERNKDTNYATEIISTPNFFTWEGELLTVHNLLNSLEDTLKDIERKNGKNKHYLQFLSSASNIIDNNGFIDDSEINTALNHLSNLLSGEEGDNINTLKKYMSRNNYTVKSYITNRFKQIIAKDAQYESKTIGHILTNMHSPTARKNVTGPSNKKLPSKLIDEISTVRKDRAKSTTKYNSQPTPYANLIGYTAFYRRSSPEYSNVKYSITGLGSTTAQISPKEITNDKDAAKNRFLENFIKNKYEHEHFIQTLENRISNQLGSSISLQSTNAANITKLINGEEIILDSGHKISINTKWMFYLLGECCNESIGMEISSITIKKFAYAEGGGGQNIPGKYSATGDSVARYQSQVGIDIASHSISSTVDTKQTTVGVKGHSREVKKKIKTPPTETDMGVYAIDAILE